MKVLLTLVLLIASLSCSSQPATAASTGASVPSAASARQARIKGNRNSMIYHLPGCPNYNQIAPRNIVWFSTEAEARAAGYRRAGNC